MKHVKEQCTMIVSLVVMAAMVGCASTDPSPLPGQPDPVPAPYNDPRISVTDPVLQQWLAFHMPTEVRGGDAPLMVTVPVRNLADDQYLLDYRFTFFDELGRELEPVMHWRFAAVQPKAVAHFQASALDERAETWKLQVKWSDR